SAGVKFGGNIDRRSAAADHRDLTAVKRFAALEMETVAAHVARKVHEFLRHIGEIRNAHREDHMAGNELFAVAEGQEEEIVLSFQHADLFRFHIGSEAPQEILGI